MGLNQTVHRGDYVQVGADMQIKVQCISGRKGASRVYISGPEGYEEVDTVPGRAVRLQRYGNVNATGLGSGKVILRFNVPKEIRLLLGKNQEPFGDVIVEWKRRHGVEEDQG